MNTTNITPKVSETIEVGAILSASWGYEQTNIDFYCLVEMKGEWVKVVKMTNKSEAEANGFMSTKELPGEIKADFKPIRRKASRSGWVKIDDSTYAQLWNGKVRFASHYA